MLGYCIVLSSFVTIYCVALKLTIVKHVDSLLFLQHCHP